MKLKHLKNIYEECDKGSDDYNVVVMLQDKKIVTLDEFNWEIIGKNIVINASRVYKKEDFEI